MLRKLNQKGGWRVEVSQGRIGITVNFELHLALYNDSKDPTINMYFVRDAIARQLRMVYEIRFSKDVYETTHVHSGLDNFSDRNFTRKVRKQVTVNFNLKGRLAMSERDVHYNEHLLIVKDNDFLLKKYGTRIYGSVNEIGGTIVYLNRDYIRNIINGLDNNTVPHEFGHSLGLLHVDENRSPFKRLGFKSSGYWDDQKQKQNSHNVMFSGHSRYNDDLSSTDLTREQVELIIDNYQQGNVNLQF
jgi:hypothetical protein